MRRWPLVVAVVFGLSLAACSSSPGTSNAGSSSSGDLSSSNTSAPTTTTTSPAVTPDALGTAATLTAGGSTAGTVTVTAVDVSQQPGSQYGSSPQNGYFAIAHISMKADPSYTAGLDANPTDFYVLVNGTQYSFDNANADSAYGNNQGLMDSTTLGAGQSTSGLVAFDISAAHGTIVYAPNSNSQPVAEWSF